MAAPLCPGCVLQVGATQLCPTCGAAGCVCVQTKGRCDCQPGMTATTMAPPTMGSMGMVPPVIPPSTTTSAGGIEEQDASTTAGEREAESTVTRTTGRASCGCGETCTCGDRCDCGAECPCCA